MTGNVASWWTGKLAGDIAAGVAPSGLIPLTLYYVQLCLLIDDDSGEVLLMPMKAGVDAVDDDSDAEVNTEAENDPAAERADSDETDLGSPAVMTRSPDIPSAFDLM